MIFMPLTYAEIGKSCIVKKIGGNPQTKRFLESLGFIEGSTVTVVNEMGGNVIVNVKESRIAVSKEMAVKIMV